MTAEITIPPEAIEAAAKAMAEAGYGFAGIKLTDPYTADADYWDHTALAACLAMLKAWPGMREHTVQVPDDISDDVRYTLKRVGIILPLPQEGE